MSLFGSIAGGVLGIGGSIFGGISASRAMKKAKKMIEQDKAENQNWYDRRYNEDATQRADAQRILTMMQDSIRQRNRAAAGAQAVTGASEESVAATKAANNQALADATSQIAAAGDRRKDQIEQQYLQTKADLNTQLRNLEIGRANTVSQTVKGLAQVGANLGGLFPSNDTKMTDETE